MNIKLLKKLRKQAKKDVKAVIEDGKIYIKSYKYGYYPGSGHNDWYNYSRYAMSYTMISIVDMLYCARRQYIEYRAKEYKLKQISDQLIYL
jgi:hypothetical protein